MSSQFCEYPIKPTPTIRHTALVRLSSSFFFPFQLFLFLHVWFHWHFYRGMSSICVSDESKRNHTHMRHLVIIKVEYTKVTLRPRKPFLFWLINVHRINNWILFLVYDQISQTHIFFRSNSALCVLLWHHFQLYLYKFTSWTSFIAWATAKSYRWHSRFARK